MVRVEGGGGGRSGSARFGLLCVRLEDSREWQGRREIHHEWNAPRQKSGRALGLFPIFLSFRLHADIKLDIVSRFRVNLERVPMALWAVCSWAVQA